MDVKLDCMDVSLFILQRFYQVLIFTQKDPFEKTEFQILARL